eukprot:1368231-Lingulodinium_polyedra.AAC.1
MRTAVRTERAGVRFLSRSAGERSIRPHHCARFSNPCTITRSNRPCRRGGSQIARVAHTMRTRQTGVRM